MNDGDVFQDHVVPFHIVKEIIIHDQDHHRRGKLVNLIFIQH